MDTCDACLEGTRCKQRGCPCVICSVSVKTPTAVPGKAKPAPRKRKPPKPLPAGSDNGSTRPMTKAEEDALCNDLLKLCQAIRLRQIQETAGYELRETMRAMALKRADEVVDIILKV